jgi:hypothetical protein
MCTISFGRSLTYTDGSICDVAALGRIGLCRDGSSSDIDLGRRKEITCETQIRATQYSARD